MEAFETNPDLPNMMIAPKFRSPEEEHPEPAGSGGRGSQARHCAARDGVRPWLISTAIAASCCPPTCSRPSGIISAPTPSFEDDQEIAGPRHTNWTGEGGEISSGVYNV